jgi:hypothetical protein
MWRQRLQLLLCCSMRTELYADCFKMVKPEYKKSQSTVQYCLTVTGQREGY